eukprot:441743_1
MNGGGSQEDLYDEFGNYIGPDLASSDEESSDDDDDASEASSDNNNNNDDDEDQQSVVSEMEIDGDDNNNNNQLSLPTEAIGVGVAAPANQIILHEDKVHYPSASTIYGPNVTTAVLDEDAMDISQPILPPEPEHEPSLVASKT